MTDLAPIAPKISKLLPLLASDKDGEVIATVRAIGRTLQSAGADWHTLAAALEEKPPIPFEDDPEPPPYQHRPQERWGGWERLRSNEKEMALEAIQRLPRLSDWEERFVASVSETVRGNPGAPLTHKQVGVLDRLLARLNAGGARW